MVYYRSILKFEDKMQLDNIEIEFYILDEVSTESYIDSNQIETKIEKYSHSIIIFFNLKYATDNYHQNSNWYLE